MQRRTVPWSHGRWTIEPVAAHVSGDDLVVEAAKGSDFWEKTLDEGTSDVLSNPTIVVEVLSASTEQYDRGTKWDGYQRLRSLMDYVPVSQAEARIEHFHRGERGQWVYRSAGAGEFIELTNGISLEVDRVFAGALDLPGAA